CVLMVARVSREERLMISRRRFLASAVAGAAAAGLYRERVHAAAPLETYKDPMTGARVHKLTTVDMEARVVYQTHPQWSADQSRFLYISQRPGGWVPVVLDMATGKRRPLVESPVTEFLDVANNR